MEFQSPQSTKCFCTVRALQLGAIMFPVVVQKMLLLRECFFAQLAEIFIFSESKSWAMSLVYCLFSLVPVLSAIFVCRDISLCYFRSIPQSLQRQRRIYIVFKILAPSSSLKIDFTTLVVQLYSLTIKIISNRVLFRAITCTAYQV